MNFVTCLIADINTAAHLIFIYQLGFVCSICLIGAFIYNKKCASCQRYFPRFSAVCPRCNTAKSQRERNIDYFVVIVLHIMGVALMITWLWWK